MAEHHRVNKHWAVCNRNTNVFVLSFSCHDGSCVNCRHQTIQPRNRRSWERFKFDAQWITKFLSRIISVQVLISVHEKYALILCYWFRFPLCLGSLERWGVRIALAAWICFLVLQFVGSRLTMICSFVRAILHLSSVILRTYTVEEILARIGFKR
jgi:hypothetical protein